MAHRWEKGLHPIVERNHRGHELGSLINFGAFTHSAGHHFGETSRCVANTASAGHHSAPLTPSQQKELVTTTSNDTEHEFPSDKCLPDLLWEQVHDQAHSTAVVCGDETLTYRDLAASTSRLAVYLEHLGVVPDDCVGLFVEPSTELMVGVWGILCSGGAYLPLAPGYPDERLRYMIEDSRTTVIVTQQKLRARLTELAPDTTTIVTLQDAAAFADSNPTTGEHHMAASLRPKNLAYVIFTSGTTGKPKGVMIEHRSIVNQMHFLQTAYKLNRDRIVLQKTPMSFDAAQWEILAPSCGSKVVMGSPGLYRDAERLIETIATANVTTLQCVPTLLQALLDTDELHRCTSLTHIFSGGEALSRAITLRCIEALPNCELVNLYGPTECTINSSAYSVDRDTLGDGPNTISIGRPVHNTQYHILGGSLSPVAVGEIGELYIGGVQLARGYLHHPDLTAKRFIDSPLSAAPDKPKLYRTGDLAYWNHDGTVQFAGRTDSQVKLRGFRVELDEIRLTIETHDWVKSAAVVVKDDPRTGHRNLIAFIELNPKEAALMDQGNHGAHHQSKESKLQIRAQLSNMGCRDSAEVNARPVVALSGKTATDEQKRQVFARKTYRFFDGGCMTEADILKLLRGKVTKTASRSLDTLHFDEFGEILRYFGQYHSGERLLPKYGYASPGALYATQMYVEVSKIGDLKPGHYYYHPVDHQLILIRETDGSPTANLKIHFIGKRRAIEPVYKNNIKEVLEIEAGHMVGLFDNVLPRYGLAITALEYAPATKERLDCADEDYYLGTFEIIPNTVQQSGAPLDIYLQIHPRKGVDLPAGQYHYREGALTKISDELVLKRHVIAINQQIYDRSSFGITVISRAEKDWIRYIDLGRKLQEFQMNDINLGFMSSGYSSRTGNDLPSARRIDSILMSCGHETGPSYFFVGGRVTDAQVRSHGMKEDVVHMKGPAEMIRDDLRHFLPDYMIPNRVTVLDGLPLTVNGKIDVKTLEGLCETSIQPVDRPFVAPRTSTEKRIHAIWTKAMKRDAISVHEDFFECGGNSLLAVAIINKTNRAFQSSVPLQVLFECPTIEKLALKVDGEGAAGSSRLVPLQTQGSKNPVYCWPGLGGYPMNWRLLAGQMDIDRPFYGVQAYGINRGEEPYPTIKEMAAGDVKAIRRLQPLGPYTLWGYSFGARVAFETAYQLEQSGERVEHLFLIAPGSPKTRAEEKPPDINEPTYANEAYVTILFSVFAGSITHPLLKECLGVARDDESFASFICRRFKDLDPDLVKRIIGIVSRTYQFKYTFQELAGRQISAPVTIFKVRGDDYSFIEHSGGYSSRPPIVLNLDADHYGILKEPGIHELTHMIRYRLRAQVLEDNDARARGAGGAREPTSEGRPPCHTS